VRQYICALQRLDEEAKHVIDDKYAPFCVGRSSLIYMMSE
jgi:hypothetical protein